MKSLLRYDWGRWPMETLTQVRGRYLLAIQTCMNVTAAPVSVRWCRM